MATITRAEPPWPATTRLREDDVEIAGVSLETLRQTVGTPFLAYDSGELAARCDAAVAAFGAGNVAYAFKAFTCLAMARLVHSRGLLVDVASTGELRTALRAGVPTEDVVVHGNGKSFEYLDLAVSAGVGCIVLDEFGEIDRVEALAREHGRRVDTRVRITTGIAAGAHAAIRTGGETSKFGVLESTGEAASAVAAVRGSPWLRLLGVHAHAGSQVLRASDLRASAHAAARFAVSIGAESLVVGRGAGISYAADEHAPGFDEWAGAVREGCAAAGWDRPVGVEPGRSIAGPPGVTVYTVRSVKQREDAWVIAVDGGFTDNLRPALYGSRYEAWLLRSPRAARTSACRIVGVHCESGDLLVSEARLPADVVPGDGIVVPATGAYGYAMASTYNRMPRPPVLFIRNGRATVVIRRETDEDLLRLDVAQPEEVGTDDQQRAVAGAA